jgi:hypothetical protein
VIVCRVWGKSCSSMDVEVRDIVDSVGNSKQRVGKGAPKSVYAVHSNGRITRAWARSSNKTDTKTESKRCLDRVSQGELVSMTLLALGKGRLKLKAR